MTNYRMLKKGEKIRNGDQWCNGGLWTRAVLSIGCTVAKGSDPIRRPLTPKPRPKARKAPAPCVWVVEDRGTLQERLDHE
jgi:hypothetical protein